jgi:hypothetical protein
MEWVAKGDPGEAVSVQAPWATFYEARNNELLQRKTGNRILLLYANGRRQAFVDFLKNTPDDAHEQKYK